MRNKLIPTFFILFILLILSTIVIIGIGASFPMILTPLTTMTGFFFALLHASQRLGWKNAMILLGLSFVVSLFFESLGVATGLVYGPYHYTDLLGPKFLGLVPYLIAAAWFMMMYPSFVIADRLIPISLNKVQRMLCLASAGGLIMTAWDVVMDPIMVKAGHWVWETNGAYFGVPLQNYWGWWLTVFCVFMLYLLITGAHTGTQDNKFDRMALTAYLVLAAGNCITAGMTGLGGPALAGFFAIIPWVSIGFFQTINKK